MAALDGRFAPSPTGPLHLGSLRTALLAWLFARSARARFIVRVEDLDDARVRPGAEAGQLADLGALGLEHDGPVVRQSERLERYAQAIRELQAADRLYPCYCTRNEIRTAASAQHGTAGEGAYPGTCGALSAAQRRSHERSERPPALRLRGEPGAVDFLDRLHGPQRRISDDVVVRRNDGVAAYNLAVVVDDHAQRIGEVVRGDDLLSGTARQVEIARALGLAVPSYAHVPLVLGADGRRLAKRHGAVTLADRVAAGERPDAVRAQLAQSLGLAQPGELPRLEQLLERFDPSLLPRASWRLDV
jgi:glutamyl-tRNA synthetase